MATVQPFTTPLEPAEAPLSGIAGPWRSPRNLLIEQTYNGHSSIHDEGMAAVMGFAGAPIEGPTHFSQVVPLAVQAFGPEFLSEGCISAHFRTPVFEGEQVRAVLGPSSGSMAEAGVYKEDGTEVLRASASLGPDHPRTMLEERLTTLRPLENSTVLSKVAIGMRSPREIVRLPLHERMGDLYPFSLREKLDTITEYSPWYDPEAQETSPWGRPIVPFEMISVLCNYTLAQHPFPVAEGAVGLFADLEVRVANGPLFVDTPYELEREVVAMSGSRRTESLWIRGLLFDPSTDRLRGSMLLNQAYFRGAAID